jgi:hypothetical protein
MQAANPIDVNTLRLAIRHSVKSVEKMHYLQTTLFVCNFGTLFETVCICDQADLKRLICEQAKIHLEDVNISMQTERFTYLQVIILLVNRQTP